jgi:hypothetical protein
LADRVTPAEEEAPRGVKTLAVWGAGTAPGKRRDLRTFPEHFFGTGDVRPPFFWAPSRQPPPVGAALQWAGRLGSFGSNWQHLAFKAACAARCDPPAAGGPQRKGPAIVAPRAAGARRASATPSACARPCRRAKRAGFAQFAQIFAQFPQFPQPFSRHPRARRRPYAAVSASVLPF